ncbi:hypothetical protein ECTPHS_02304 [Ectothiorhodospira sp. PHS-1]|nr:hypothetical protein ECTPHS_02304 [Ectothiorhodospira sp. PHS-1]
MGSWTQTIRQDRGLHLIMVKAGIRPEIRYDGQLKTS